MPLSDLEELTYLAKQRFNMSEDLSTKFPKSSKLRPIPPVRSKIWRGVSLILIIGGLALLGTGGWMFYQFQVEANKPPPARILEPPIAADEVEAPTSEPSLAEIEPTTTLQKISRPAPAVEPMNTLAPEPTLIREVDSVKTTVPPESPDLVEETAPVEETNPVAETAPGVEIVPEEIASPPQEADSAIDYKFLEETALAQENTLFSEPTADAPLSLAVNPLIVAGDVSAPTEAEIASRQPTVTISVSSSILSATIRVGGEPAGDAGPAEAISASVGADTSPATISGLSAKERGTSAAGSEKRAFSRARAVSAKNL